MSKWLKVTIGVSVSLAVLIIAAGFIFHSMLTKSLPKYSGEISSENIGNDIKIFRDSMAVPYIVAKNDLDAAFALGYVHAEERMFTMDLARRAGEGRLSQIFGKETIPFDKMFLTVGIKRTSEKLLKNISPESLKLLKAYSKGVNLYIKNYKGKYPAEFDVLGYDPQKWTPLSSLIIIRMMAWELNISWWSDITFTKLVQKFGVEKAREIIPDYPENAPLIIPGNLQKFGAINTDLIKTDQKFRNFMGWQGTHIGSNNWIVNGKLSKSGKPIIANDTHLALSAPGRWFAAVIKSPDWDVAGVTLPGAPAVVVGKNRNISWAVTNIMEDDADFYFEKIDSSGTKYLLNGNWNNLTIEKDTVIVKDSSNIVFDVKITDHGPIISNIHPYNFLFPSQNVDNQNISMQWLGNEMSDELLAFYKINTAKNWSDFKEAFNTYSVPGQNFIYGDNSGNIGYVFGAKLPIREANRTTFILDGTTTQNDWKGFVPRNDLPTLFNPSQNYIATANNKTEKNYKYYISNVWEPSSRIERITELLNSKSKHSDKDFQQYQMDITSPYAKETN